VFSSLNVKEASKGFDRVETYFIYEQAQMFALNPAF